MQARRDFEVIGLPTINDGLLNRCRDRLSIGLRCPKVTSTDKQWPERPDPTVVHIKQLYTTDPLTEFVEHHTHFAISKRTIPESRMRRNPLGPDFNRGLTNTPHQNLSRGRDGIRRFIA